MGATFDEAMAKLDPSEGLEDCLHRILLPSRSLIPESEIPSAPVEGGDSTEAKGTKRGVEELEDPDVHESSAI